MTIQHLKQKIDGALFECGRHFIVEGLTKAEFETLRNIVNNENNRRTVTVITTKQFIKWFDDNFERNKK